MTLNLLKRVPHVLDASDPGTGKTRAHIEGFLHVRKLRKGACLIICPKSLMDPAWGQDIRRFAPQLSVSLAFAENREKAFAVEADVYITNTDATKWLVKQPKKFFNKFSMVIIDEIQYFKHHTAQRSSAMAKIAKYFPYRRGLGATLTANTVCDIWHPMYILDGGERLGRIFSGFRAAVSIPVQVGPRAEHIKWEDRPGAEEAVVALIKDMSVRHEFADVMKEVPGNKQYFMTYALTPKQYKVYREMEDFTVVKLKDETISAVNAAALRTKLLQIASGAVYAGESVYEVVDTGRYELVLDLIEARKHTVVFFNWVHQKEQLVKLAKARHIDFEVIDGTVPVKKRNEIVEFFQNGFYQALFLHPKTGAHGLTLTRGTSTIWCSPIYEADMLKQGLHRIYRGGQTQATETILIEAQGTVERLVYERLMSKAGRMQNFLDILKELRNER